MAGQDKALTVVPLGGLGEIGQNCLVLKTADSIVLIDCGLMFPDDYLLGVDVVIPRFDHILNEKKLVRGIILTHAHEDHIGALPWLLPHLKAPIYASPFTLALVESKLKEHDLLDQVELKPVHPGERIQIGDFFFNFFPVCHSIVAGYCLGIETPLGRVLHTGDFKIDNDPLDGHFTDLGAIGKFAEPGVLLMFSDSTNVEREGFALTEREIKNSLGKIFAEAQGRVIITMFSSHIQRMQEVFDLAGLNSRKVCVSGKSLSTNIEIAERLGYLKIAPKSVCEPEDLPGLDDNRIVLLVTGSQGEPLSALSRIAAGEHKQLKIHPGDTVIMSSRFIPGNTRAITRLINKLYKLGAEVLYETVRAIHASGHAHRDELRIMLKTVRPKFFVPVHGEYRHLVKHKHLAVECGVAPERAIVLENGQPMTFSEGQVRFDDPIFCESILVDGKGVGDVGHTVLKERHLLGGEGMVIVIMVIDETTGEILIGPDISTKGFVFEQYYADLLEDAKCVVLDVFEEITPGSAKKLKERIRSALRGFFRKVLERDPVLIPLIIEI